MARRATTCLLHPWNTHANYELNDLGHRDDILEFDVLGGVEVGVAFQSAGGWNVDDLGGDGTPPLLTGVVFADNAGTGFYVSGEGQSGVVVTSSLSSHYAVTVNGAYSLPLDLAPEYDAGQPTPVATVTFTNADGQRWPQRDGDARAHGGRVRRHLPRRREPRPLRQRQGGLGGGGVGWCNPHANADSDSHARLAAERDDHARAERHRLRCHPDGRHEQARCWWAMRSRARR